VELPDQPNAAVRGDQVLTDGVNLAPLEHETRSRLLRRGAPFVDSYASAPWRKQINRC
jgi:hypothetical protein